MNGLVKARANSRNHALRHAFRTVLCLLISGLSLYAAPNGADDQARAQFATAVRMRTMLEGYLEKDRNVSDYKQTIDAYRKVYQTSTESDEVPPAIIAEAELYVEMGQLYDAKYYQSAIDTYRLLLEQYPDSRLRSTALFAVAQIQKDDQKKLDAAQTTFELFLKAYPRSDKAADARKALKEIAQARMGGQHGAADQYAASMDGSSSNSSGASRSTSLASTQANAPTAAIPIGDDPAVAGQRVDPHESVNHLSTVKNFQTKNAPDWSRVIVYLDDTIEFESARIEAPDRIYFNVSRAKLDPKVAAGKVDLTDGLLKSLRVAQNKPDIVRIVLDAPGTKDYSAYLLSKPYRLVIELATKPMTIAQRQPAAAPIPASAAISSAKSVDSTSALASVAVKPAVDTTPSPAMSVGANLASQPKTKPVALARKPGVPSTSLDAPILPKPTRDEDTSLTRALGLKINRIVIDAGHGGSDTGTVGPHGLLEKDLCLDVALRLGKLIQQKLPGADVVYTRKDDTFVPLEERTRIANDAKADLFISIHANSSPDPSARGVETYYLNLATSRDAMDVASRENALAQESVHDLQDVLQKIARNDKIAESKELAGDIQTSLAQRMASISLSEKNRGVKKAPFVVLIGADMPSVLSEISFVSNPTDERLLKKNDQRQRIADGLYRGIASYLSSLNSLSYNQQKFISDNRLDAGSTSAPSSPTQAAK